MGTKIYDLSQSFGQMTPLWPFPGQRQDIILQRAEYHGRFRKRSTIYTGTLHAATHMDAPIHVIDGGMTLDQIPLENCYGTGVVVDFRNMKDKKWYLISSEDFEKASPKIEKGDFVVLNTGWHKLWRVKNYDYFNYYAGLTKDGAEWLVKKGIKAIAVDHGAIDSPLWHYKLSENMPWLDREFRQETGRDPDKEFPEYEPCHRILLGNGIVCIENAGGNIDAVTGKRVTLAAFPFRLEQGDGCMVRLVAIVKE